MEDIISFITEKLEHAITLVVHHLRYKIYEKAFCFRSSFRVVKR